MDSCPHFSLAGAQIKFSMHEADEQIGKVIYHFTGHGLVNIQQMARRLLINILLANGDAHLKNWSLFYPDKVVAELAPAYDIVYAQAYIPGEKQISLNLAGNKNWYAMNMGSFEDWTKAVGAPWRAINPHLVDAMEKVRRLWPEYLANSLMNNKHKILLRKHWDGLHSDFRINTH